MAAQTCGKNGLGVVSVCVFRIRSKEGKYWGHFGELLENHQDFLQVKEDLTHS
jgi:hypothetical protein